MQWFWFFDLYFIREGLKITPQFYSCVSPGRSTYPSLVNAVSGKTNQRLSASVGPITLTGVDRGKLVNRCDHDLT